MKTLLLLAGLCLPVTAIADEQPTDLQRLTMLIDRGSEESASRRHWQAGANAAVSALGLTGGIILLSRDTNVASVAVTVEAGLRFGINAAVLAINPDPFTPLRQTLKRSQEEGLSESDTVAAVREQWHVIAEKARKRRVRSGIIQLVSAGLTGTAAVVIAAVAPAHLHMADREQGFLVSTLSLASIMNATNGAIDLTVPSTLERYTELADPTYTPPRLAFGAAPSPGGMQLGLALSF